MKKISFSSHLLKEPVKDVPRSKRAELIGQFLEKLNESRIGTKFKPLTARSVAVMLGYIKTEDLYRFYKECEYQKSFSQWFFYCRKVARNKE